MQQELQAPHRHPPYHRIDHPVENIVIVGDAAVVIGQMNADLTIDGTHKTLRNSAIAVRTKDSGEWKFVAYQPTPQAPGR